MNVSLPFGQGQLLMSAKRRKRHSPEQNVKKIRDADAMLNSGKDLAAVLQPLELGYRPHSCNSTPRASSLPASLSQFD